MSVARLGGRGLVIFGAVVAWAVALAAGLSLIGLGLVLALVWIWLAVEPTGSVLSEKAIALIGLVWARFELASARFGELLSTPLRDVPLGWAIFFALMLIVIAVHLNRSER